MDFLFVLFCSIWFGCRFTKERLQYKDVNQRSSVRLEALRSYKELYTASKELEDGIDAFVADESRREELYKELEPDLLEMFGEDYRSKFELNQKLHHKQNPLHPSIHGFFNPNPNQFHAKELLLSHKGKLSRWDTFMGFRVNVHNNQDVDLAVYEQIEKNMRRLGHDFTLVSDAENADLLNPNTPRNMFVKQVYLVPDAVAVASVRQRWWND